MSDRVMISFSLPLSKKKQIQDLIITNSYFKNERQSLSNFCAKSVILNLKVHKIQNFEDLKDIWSDIFINNRYIHLRKKLELLKDFRKEIEKEIEELEEYYAFKSLKKLENDEIAEKLEKLGQMYSPIVLELSKKKEKKWDRLDISF